MAPYRNLEEYNIEITNEVKDHFSKIVDDIGEDVTREGLIKTPERAAKAMLFLTQGYKQNAEEILKGAMFAEEYDDMVIIKDIELYSLCEHHMLPFFGKAHVAYIPNGHIVGLSKIPRVVDVSPRPSGGGPVQCPPGGSGGVPPNIYQAQAETVVVFLPNTKHIIV